MNLFAGVVESVVTRFPAGGVPDPVTENEETEQPNIPAVYRLQDRLKEMKKSEGVELNEQLAELKERLAAEKAVIKAFEDYDLQEEAKKPDFDRAEATKLHSDSTIATAVARGIADEIAAVQERLRSIEKKYATKTSRLSAFVERFDEIRRATAIEFVRGSGRLRYMDADHVRRWLQDSVNLEAQCYELFPEEDWETVAELVETLIRYEVPASSRDILYAGLHPNHKDQFQNLAPTTTTSAKEAQ